MCAWFALWVATARFFFAAVTDWLSMAICRAAAASICAVWALVSATCCAVSCWLISGPKMASTIGSLITRPTSAAMTKRTRKCTVFETMDRRREGAASSADSGP